MDGRAEWGGVRRRFTVLVSFSFRSMAVFGFAILSKDKSLRDGGSRVYQSQLGIRAGVSALFSPLCCRRRRRRWGWVKRRWRVLFVHRGPD